MVTQAQKSKFAAALRSDEYTQGFQVLLNDAGGFCALGVWADLNADGHWETDEQGYWHLVDDNCTPIHAHVGLQLHRAYELMAWNDRGDTFATIADRIEREWESE